MLTEPTLVWQCINTALSLKRWEPCTLVQSLSYSTQRPSCPGEGLTELCLFISGGPAVLLVVQARRLVPFPMSGINGDPRTDFVGLEISSE